MANDLIDDLALEEIKQRLTAIEESQKVIIGHLQGVESMLGEIAQVEKPSRLTDERLPFRPAQALDIMPEGG